VTREKQAWFWIAGIAVFVLLLYALRGVLTPFVAGMAVAYFLDPVADKLEEWGASRLVATILITMAFFAILIVGLVIMFPLLQAQVVGLIARIPDAIRFLREQAAPLAEGLQAQLGAEEMERLRGSVGDYVGEAIRWLGGLLKGLWSGGLALVELASLIFITPLVSFYLLRDWDRIVERVDSLLPRDAAPSIRAGMAEIDQTIAAFVRGQATVCLFLAVFYGIGLTLVGLDFGLLVGLSAGVISFIPYFGMLVGMAVALGIAFTQFADWVPFALIAVVFGVGQLIEGNFLTPKLVGDKVGLHPVWVVFALLAGGALFGFTGLLLAVPLAAVIGIGVRHGAARYLASPLYQGSGDADR
jgi:predicted PurR-regulated permease PerM